MIKQDIFLTVFLFSYIFFEEIAPAEIEVNGTGIEVNGKEIALSDLMVGAMTGTEAWTDHALSSPNAVSAVKMKRGEVKAVDQRNLYAVLPA